MHYILNYLISVLQVLSGWSEAHPWWFFAGFLGIVLSLLVGVLWCYELLMIYLWKNWT